MKEIIKKIFTLKNYEKIDTAENTIFYKSKNIEIEDNYMVVFYNEEIKEIEKYLLELYEGKISEYLARGIIGDAFEKNLSLILFIDVPEELKEVEIKKIIYSIEESKIYFKRYVVEYNEFQKNKFLERFLLSKNLLDEFENEIKDTKNFKNYKEKRETFYDLLIKLYIKIPFLEFVFSKENLVEKFEKDLTKDLMRYAELNTELKKCSISGEYELSFLTKSIEVDEVEIISKVKELGFKNGI